jgi:hypothetical protein
MATRLKWIEWLRRALGLDRAIVFTVAARSCQIAGSVGTVLLIVHFLSPIEQGYYYTLLGLAALQTVFELGFSFVILQMAAHESALLIFYPDGRIEGDPVAHARLASVLQLTVRWYLRAALALAAVLLPFGILFFTRMANAADRVHWHGPWVTAVFATTVTFFFTPLCSFIEGCNHVRQVARLRMYQALIVMAISWGAIASGHGIYACAMVNLGWTAACLAFFAKRGPLVLSLLHYPTGENGISWRREIWPFQWKIAASWLCSYFAMQAFTPVIFAFRGSEEAGKMGVSLSIVGYLPVVALCWMMPKAVPFGQLVKFGQLQELDSLFFKTFKQSLALILILIGTCFTAVLGVQSVFPKIALRLETPFIFALLLFAAASSFAVQSMAIYLRSFKREPYLIQSMAVAVLTVVGILLTASRWGSLAIAIIYFAVSGVAGLLWAITIFHAQRKLHLGDGGDLLAMPFCPASAADSGRFAPQNHGMERGAQ